MLPVLIFFYEVDFHCIDRYEYSTICLTIHLLIGIYCFPSFGAIKTKVATNLCAQVFA